jgi:hypothetical protein
MVFLYEKSEDERSSQAYLVRALLGADRTF